MQVHAIRVKIPDSFSPSKFIIIKKKKNLESKPISIHTEIWRERGGEVRERGAVSYTHLTLPTTAEV